MDGIMDGKSRHEVPNIINILKSDLPDGTDFKKPACIHEK